MPFFQSLSYFVALFLCCTQCVNSGLVPLVARQHEVEVKQTLESRDQVAVCKAVLVALRASAFCSTFANIHDVTQTVTSTGTPSSSTTTVPGVPCSTTLDASITTTIIVSTAPASTSTAISSILTTLAPVQTTTTVTLTSTERTTTVVTVYPTSKKRKRDSDSVEQLRAIEPVKRTATSATTSATKCAIKGIPTQLNVFVCDVVSEACSLFVHPHTTTTSTTVPGATSITTTTASPICSTITPAASTVTETTTATPAPVTTVIITTITITPSPTTVTSTRTTTTTVTATATVTGTPYGTNDCVNGQTKPASIAGYNFTFYCGATLSFYSQVSSSTQSSFTGCYQSCVTFGACDAFIYNIATGQCILSNGAFRGPVSDPGFDTGVINL